MARFAVDNYDKRFGNIDKDAYHERFGIFQKKLLQYMDEHGEAIDTAKEFGPEYVLRNHFSIMIEEGPYHYKHPGNLRMTMLERIVPLSVKGVIWYQGESNCVDGLPYPIDKWFTEVMHTMIDDWREAFCDPKLPFYIVQLSTYPRLTAFDNSWRFIRDVHEKLGEEENIYTVVAADIGEFDNIHPIDKKPVGERLALAALANEYGKDVKWQSPKLNSFSRKNGKYVFGFDNSEYLTFKGDTPEGFFITLKSGEIIPCDAEINGATIEINENPDAKAVGYCDINYCIANIYNEAGLPLFPFHQDL
jgi:sialate O-acetylesterase